MWITWMDFLLHVLVANPSDASSQWSSSYFCAMQHTLPLSFPVSHTLSLSVSVSPFCIFSLTASSSSPFSFSGRLSLSASSPLLLFLILILAAVASASLHLCAVLYLPPGQIKRIWDGGMEGGSTEEGWRIKDGGGERKRGRIVAHTQLQIGTARQMGWRHSWLLPVWASRLIFFSPFAEVKPGKRETLKSSGTSRTSGNIRCLWAPWWVRGLLLQKPLPGRPNTFQSRHRWTWIERHRREHLFVGVPLEICTACEVSSVADVSNVFWLHF